MVSVIMLALIVTMTLVVMKKSYRRPLENDWHILL